MKTTIAPALLVAFIGVLSASMGAEVIEQVLVKVNGDIVTKTELEQRLTSAVRQGLNAGFSPAELELHRYLWSGLVFLPFVMRAGIKNLNGIGWGRGIVLTVLGGPVFALTSDEEGFVMVLIEAMSCGVPVVSTACGGPDAVVRDGVDGYLVPVRDAATLADRIERLVRDTALNRRMGTAAREAALGRFDTQRAGRALLDTYDTLVCGAS